MRDLIDRREAQLLKIIEGLESICEGVETADIEALKMTPAFTALLAEGVEPGLQEACRAVIYAHSPTPLTPTDVRDALESAGFSTKNYSNPMATVHKALKRLHDDPDSNVFGRSIDGKMLYGWMIKSTPGHPQRRAPGNLYDKMIDPNKLKEAVYQKKPWMRPGAKPPDQEAKNAEVPKWFQFVKEAGGIKLKSVEKTANDFGIKPRGKRDTEE